MKETNTFRQRLPDTAYHRRAEDPHWGDKVFQVDESKADKGYAAGGGLVWAKLKSEPGSMSQLVRTGKVQQVPAVSRDTGVLPPHYAAISTQRFDEAKQKLRPYALQVYDRLLERRGRNGGPRAQPHAPIVGRRAAAPSHRGRAALHEEARHRQHPPDA